jgi:hypothetical protein
MIAFSAAILAINDLGAGRHDEDEIITHTK